MAKRKSTKRLKEELTTRTPLVSGTIKSSDLLSSGSTILNLVCTGKPSGAFYKGGYFHLPGKADSGKTVVVMTAFAEAVRSKSFRNYKLIHDNPEGGAMMDSSLYGGKKTVDKIEDPPRGTSEWVEDFFYNLDDLYAMRKSFIYVLDSLDALGSEQDEKQFVKKKSARGTQEKAGGDYHLARPKLISQGLRKAMSELPRTGSILLVISQTRDNVGASMFEQQDKYSGGRALEFYTRLQLWFSGGRAINKKIQGNVHQIGIQCRVRVKKNHVTGKKATVEFPIYHSYGIDDIGSMVDWLLDNNGGWGKAPLKKDKSMRSRGAQRTGSKPKGSNNIKAPEFDFVGTKADLISKIEIEGRYKELQLLVAATWRSIEEATQLKRPRRYSDD